MVIGRGRGGGGREKKKKRGKKKRVKKKMKRGRKGRRVKKTKRWSPDDGFLCNIPQSCQSPQKAEKNVYDAKVEG